MTNNSNTTSHHINGFWFHIKWESEKKGYDQHGNIWLNKSNPECDNKNVVIACVESNPKKRISNTK